MSPREARQTEMPEIYRERASQTPYAFTLGDHDYKCHGLLPLEEIHLARRLAPIALSALKPEGGRSAVLGQLFKIAALAGEAEGADASSSPQNEVVSNAIDLAISVLEAASATSEEAIDEIIKRIMKKVWRRVPNSSGDHFVPIWDTNWNVPSKRDIDGFTILAIVARYIVLAFQDRILEYVVTIAPNVSDKVSAGKARPRPPAAPASGV